MEEDEEEEEEVHELDGHDDSRNQWVENNGELFDDPEELTTNSHSSFRINTGHDSHQIVGDHTVNLDLECMDEDSPRSRIPSPSNFRFPNLNFSSPARDEPNLPSRLDQSGDLQEYIRPPGESLSHVDCALDFTCQDSSFQNEPRIEIEDVQWLSGRRSARLPRVYRGRDGRSRIQIDDDIQVDQMDQDFNLNQDELDEIDSFFSKS
jgi:hypothetical protein